MKHFLTEYSRKELHAGYKAVKDASAILSRHGYKPIVFYNKYGDGFIPRLIRFVSWSFLLLKLRKEETVFILWPYYRIHPLSRLLDILQKKKSNLQILIHDLNSLREYGDSSLEMKFFMLAQLLIVHTDAMKNHLVSLGIEESKIKVLTSFDYLTDDIPASPRTNSAIVAFAGNLSKSTFLSRISDENVPLKMNCYGRQIPLNSPIVYKGTFQPENVSVLKGSWGLVWDGISLDGCVGDFGEYLKYNSPHKLSLYIVAGLPLIVWTKSALARYVVENHLGITVDSIREIPDKLSGVSDEEYQDMLSCVEKESALLKSGSHLSSIIESKS